MPDSHVIELDFSKGLDAPDSPGQWVGRREHDHKIFHIKFTKDHMQPHYSCQPARWLKLVDATPKRPPQPFPEAVWVDDKWCYPEGWWVFIDDENEWLVFQSEGDMPWCEGERRVTRLPDPTQETSTDGN